MHSHSLSSALLLFAEEGLEISSTLLLMDCNENNFTQEKQPIDWHQQREYAINCDIFTGIVTAVKPAPLI